MVKRTYVDRAIYDSCKEYADRMIQQKLTKSDKPACDGTDGIIELCKKCPYYRFHESGLHKN